MRASISAVTAPCSLCAKGEGTDNIQARDCYFSCVDGRSCSLQLSEVWAVRTIFTVKSNTRERPIQEKDLQVYFALLSMAKYMKMNTEVWASPALTERLSVAPPRISALRLLHPCELPNSEFFLSPWRAVLDCLHAPCKKKWLLSTE